MSKRTPGPWHHAPNVLGYEGCVIHGPSNEMIADVYDAGNPDGSTLLANARLIAAAPELLEAARSILAFHSKHMVGLPLCIDGQPIDHTLLNRATELANAAIARAEGR